MYLEHLVLDLHGTSRDCKTYNLIENTITYFIYLILYYFKLYDKIIYILHLYGSVTSSQQ